MPILTCEICGVQSLTTQKIKSKYVTDRDGNVWQNGDTCASCVELYSFPLYEDKTERCCRLCEKALTRPKRNHISLRYFYCHGCISTDKLWELSSDIFTAQGYVNTVSVNIKVGNDKLADKL